MRNPFLRMAAVLCAASAWLPAGHAQDAALSVWRIEIHGLAPGSVADYSADLEDKGHQKVASANLRADSVFEFRDIPYGDYFLAISDMQGNTVYRGMITARASDVEDSVDVKQSGEPQRPPSGPISVAELQHPPSRQAFAACLAAQRLSEQSRFAQAAEQLEKAVRLSPKYAVAHSNLAAAYARLGRFEDAVAEARQSMDLSRPNAVDLGNTAYAEFRLNRRTDAIQAAEEGLSVDPASAKLHYILGALLAMNRSTLPQSIPHLEAAAKTIEGARANLEEARRALR